MIHELLYGVLGAVAAGAGLFLKLYYPWIMHDIRMLQAYGRVFGRVNQLTKTGQQLIDIFVEDVKKHPDKIFCYYEDKSYTYRAADQHTNCFAHALMSLDVRCGDDVAIMLHNGPEYIWALLGFLKIGARVALVNPSSRAKSLIHLVKTCNPNVLIIGKDPVLLSAVKDISQELGDLAVYVFDDGTSPTSDTFNRLHSVLERSSTSSVDPEQRSSVQLCDPAVYIYTSGTTGLPKAAILTQRRIMDVSTITNFADVLSSDTIYVTLPLYHTAGVGCGLFGTVGTGATMVLRRKFSASSFWDDCRKHDVTVILYIGELCRYLVSMPRTSLDKIHTVRVAFGNGLRQDIWEKFKERFNVPSIVEYYGATEGTSSFINVANKVGAIGRNSPVLQAFIPNKIVEYDVLSEGPTRNAKGLCTPVGPGKTGILLTPVSEKFKLVHYVGPKEWTDKKLIRDVLRPGDVYFNTGDLVCMDSDYFVYFKDRVGDTFRWKGENVSTTEVANILTELEFITDANVYGVKIPGQEGRAGMAAILANEGRRLSEEQRSALYRLCDENLVPWARPRFLRVQKQGTMTGTHKQRKVELVEEGFSLHRIDDPLYLLDQDQRDYVPFDERLYLRVINGGIRI